MAPPTKFMQMVDASKDEASLAVRLYNDPSEPRSFEAFVVHMHLAWLYLLHAELTRAGVDFRYWTTAGKVRRLIKVDGEPRQWELARCVEERWPNEMEPVWANLGFFIGLRNKIEHRYARQQEALTVAVGGHAQALLLNYEEELTSQFGDNSSLATRLRFPVFIGSFTDEGERALRRLRSLLPAPLRTFIAEYDAGLDEAVANDPHYEFRLRVVQELTKKDADALAVQFTRFDDLTDEQRATVEEMGKKGAVIVREQKRAWSGTGSCAPPRRPRPSRRRSPSSSPRGCSPRRGRSSAFVHRWGTPPRADERQVLLLRRAAQGLRLHGRLRREGRQGVQHRVEVPEVPGDDTPGQGDGRLGGRAASRSSVGEEEAGAVRGRC